MKYHITRGKTLKRAAAAMGEMSVAGTIETLILIHSRHSLSSVSYGRRDSPAGCDAHSYTLRVSSGSIKKSTKKVIGWRWLWYIVKWWLDTYISTSEQLQQHELRVSMAVWRGENCKKTFDTLAASAWFFFLHVVRCDIFSAMARTLSGSLISFFLWYLSKSWGDT